MVEHKEGRGMPGEALDAARMGALYVFGGCVVLFLAVLLAALVWTGAIVSLLWWVFSLPVRLLSRPAHEARR